MYFKSKAGKHAIIVFLKKAARQEIKVLRTSKHLTLNKNIVFGYVEFSLQYVINQTKQVALLFTSLLVAAVKDKKNETTLTRPSKKLRPASGMSSE